MSERNEATLEQWRELYEAADALQKRKPWETFWDTDIVAIQEGDLEDAAFFSILGAGGDRYGFTMYEGLRNLNKFYLFLSSEKLGIPEDFAVIMQTCLACFIDVDEPLSEDRKKILRQLGIKYRGKKNTCPYFVAYEAKYEPSNLNAEQVARLTRNYRLLNDAISYYEDNRLELKFEGSTIYAYRQNDSGQWAGGAGELPSSVFEIRQPRAIDLNQIRALREAREASNTLQVDVVVIPEWLDVEDYGRACAFMVGLLVDRDSGLIAGGDVFPPTASFMEYVASHVDSYIRKFGRPATIEYTNSIIGVALKSVCSLCHIQLKKVQSMPELDAAALSLKMSFTS